MERRAPIECELGIGFCFCLGYTEHAEALYAEIVLLGTSKEFLLLNLIELLNGVI